MKKKALRIFLAFMGCMLLLTLVSRGIYAYTLPRVSTVSISNIALDHSVKGDGTVEKNSEAPICALPGIRIDEICVKEGEKVEEGSVLFRLNNESLQDYITSLQTEVTTLALQVSDAQNNAALATSEKQEEIERASADYNTTASQYDRKISEAGADLQRATEARDALGSRDSYNSSVSGNDSGSEWDSLYRPLDDAVIAAQRAYDDAITAKNNAMVSAGRTLEDAQAPDNQNSSAQSTSLLLAEKKADLKKYKDFLKNGTDLYQMDIAFDSSMASIGESGSFYVKSFNADRDVCLPLSAIHSDGMRYYVYVMNTGSSILGEELTVSQKVVTIADKNDTYAALDNSGLTDEDSIIVSSTKPLTDGQTVRLITE